MNRLFLYSGLFFILLLIFDAYDRDYNQIQIANTESAEDVAPQTSNQPPDERSLTSVDTDKEVNKNRKIEMLESDKLLVKFDVTSGEILFSELKDYSKSLGSKENIVILDHENKKYTAASSIQILNTETQPSFTKKKQW